MAETVKLPQIGKVDKKYVYAGIAVVIGIAGYAYWKRNAGTSDEGGIDPNAIDPLTGLPYSSSIGGGGGSYVNPAPTTTEPIIDLTGDTIKTNQEWAVAVTTKLGEIGYESGYVAIILGKYLSSQQVTKEEAELIRTAWAYFGHPPEDRQIILVPTAPPPAPAPTPTPTPTPAPPQLWTPPPTIRRGSTGAVVKQAQVSLNGWGFSPGPIDGIFGSKTEAATKSFQRAKGLVVDGVIGPKTWIALHGSPYV